MRSALLRANQQARVTRNAAEIQRTADRYATCSVKTARVGLDTAAVWRMSDRLQQRQGDGTWVDADPGSDCDDGELIILPETTILTEVLAGSTVLPILEDLLGGDWKDLFRVGDCITIDAGKPNEESACIVEHGSLVLDRPLQFDHDRFARVIMDVPGEVAPIRVRGTDPGDGGTDPGDGPIRLMVAPIRLMVAPIRLMVPIRVMLRVVVALRRRRSTESARRYCPQTRTCPPRHPRSRQRPTRPPPARPLAITGSDPWRVVRVGLVLLVLGAALALLGRRRRQWV